MPAVLAPAIDPSASAADVYTTAGVLEAPLQPPPDPAAGWDAPPGSQVPLVQAVLGRIRLDQAIQREVIGELVTADVEDSDEDVELLAGCTASITASAWDPLWEACAKTTTMGADGLPKYTFDPGEFIVWIWEDGVCTWTGRFTEPVSFGDGTVGLPAQGPQSVFGERILGHAEQPDLLGDRGSFERYSSIAEMEADGWVFPPGMLKELVAGGARGAQSLRIKGEGWVRSPRVPTDGGSIGKAVKASVFGRWPSTVRAGLPVVSAWVQRTDSLRASNEALSLEKAGGRPGTGESWSESPVDGSTRTSAGPVLHRAGGMIRGVAGVWSTYDLLRIVESIQTGFQPGDYRDLAEYIPRIMIDLHSKRLGGSPTGLTWRIMAMTGTTASMRWEHAKRAKLRDVLSMVLNAEGGPECRITPGWVLEVWDRLGTDSGITLSVHEILKPGWQVDPGAQVQDHAVDTGRGSGGTAIVSVVSQAGVSTTWRRYAEVTGPTERTLDEIESWNRAHARTAARQQVTLEAEIPAYVAAQVNIGDTLWVIQHDGHVAMPELRMRVLRKRKKYKRLTAVVSLGADE